LIAVLLMTSLLYWIASCDTEGDGREDKSRDFINTTQELSV